MVMMRTQRLGTCRPDKPHWSVGQRPTNAGQERGFSWISHCLGQTPSDLCQELLGADTYGSKCFQCHSKKLWVPLSELYLFFFSDSCSLSGTGTGDGILLQISIPQSVDHCDVPSGTTSGVPWQQRQTVRPLAVVIIIIITIMLLSVTTKKVNCLLY